jgi:hypothetical protein
MWIGVGGAGDGSTLVSMTGGFVVNCSTGDDWTAWVVGLSPPFHANANSDSEDERYADNDGVPGQHGDAVAGVGVADEGRVGGGGGTSKLIAELLLTPMSYFEWQLYYLGLAQTRADEWSSGRSASSKEEIPTRGHWKG